MYVSSASLFGGRWGCRLGEEFRGVTVFSSVFLKVEFVRCLAYFGEMLRVSTRQNRTSVSAVSVNPVFR